MREATPCLRDRRTGELVPAVYSLASPADVSDLQRLGWSFDWQRELESGRTVYRLQVDGEAGLQGLVSLTVDARGRFCEVHLVESAPWNVGRAGRFRGVGGFLFAIACRESIDCGGDGVVGFTAKTALVAHYGSALGATRIGRSSRMQIDPRAARDLIAQYLG